MRRPPRPPTESIFAQGLWQHILWVGLFIGTLSIVMQAWAPLLLAVIATFGLQVAVLYVPWLQRSSKTAALTAAELGACVLLASFVLVAVEVEKWLVRNAALYARV